MPVNRVRPYFDSPKYKALTTKAKQPSQPEPPEPSNTVLLIVVYAVLLVLFMAMVVVSAGHKVPSAYSF